MFYNKNISNPYTIVVSVTDKCNTICPGCLAFKDSSRSELSLNEFAELFNIFKANSVARISFAGGEPLLRKDITDIIKLAHSHGFSTALCTNGILLDQEILKKLDGILNNLIVPLHSLQPQIAQQLTPYANQKHINKILKLYDFINSHLAIHIKSQTILSRINSQLGDLFALGQELIDHGIQTWKVDQYYHVDKPAEIKNRFWVADREYDYDMDILHRYFADTALNVAGMGGTLRSGQDGFLISSKGNAFINIEGAPADKILGNIYSDYKKLFYSFNEQQIKKSYESLPTKEAFHEKTIDWVVDFLDCCDIKPGENLALVNLGQAAELIALSLIYNIRQTVFEEQQPELTKKMIEKEIKLLKSLGYSPRGNCQVFSQDFKSQTKLAKNSQDNLVLAFKNELTRETISENIKQIIQALTLLKNAGQIIFIANSKYYAAYYNLIIDLLDYLKIDYQSKVTFSVARPFLKTFGFGSAFIINNKYFFDHSNSFSMEKEINKFIELYKSRNIDF